MATGVVNETVYVAVKADVQEEGMMTLLWALENLRGQFCILHVHNPSDYGLSGELEMQNMHMNLDDYVNICNQAQVPVEKQWIEATDTSKGIVEFILQHNVSKLVMGAAADEHYTEGMTELKSTKAIFVVEHAHPSCSIWFICGGQLIHSRKGDLIRTASEDDLALVLIEENQEGGSQASVLSYEDDLQLAMPRSLERNSHEELYEKLKRTMADTEKAKLEAYEELVNRQEAEKDAIEATKRAKIFEDHYYREVQQREELEEMLAKERERYEDKVKELDEAQFQLQQCEQDREDLQLLLDNLLKVNDDVFLMNQAGEHPSSSSPRQEVLMEFSPSELKEATNNFDPSLKIGDGDNWSSYKGMLRHTQVTIKRLHSDGPHSSLQYHLEVEVMNKLRHPNIVMLIGVCPDDYTLIYEHLPNGSLENQLFSSSSVQLSWQSRIRISAELCSALIYLHSSKILHGNLKSTNVLLDANFVSKLGHFEFDDQSETSDRETEDFSEESDISSFGIILLQLLTRRSDPDLAAEVEDADDVSAMLDSTAGDWPVPEAMQLAELALKCCVSEQYNRPDLKLEVWSLLESMRLSTVASAPPSSNQHHQTNEPPEYFICPISRDIMEDPHVAADGFTYEGETIREWLNSGHETSPMTNLELLHDYLTPNHSLRSAIQEWLQTHQND